MPTDYDQLLLESREKKEAAGKHFMDIRTQVIASKTGGDGSGVPGDETPTELANAYHRAMAEFEKASADFEATEDLVERIRLGEVLVNQEGVTLGESLRRARMLVAPRLTQQQVADNLGRGKASVSDWEKDKYKPDGAMFRKLMRLYQTSEENLGFRLVQNKIEPLVVQSKPVYRFGESIFEDATSQKTRPIPIFSSDEPGDPQWTVQARLDSFERKLILSPSEILVPESLDSGRGLIGLRFITDRFASSRLYLITYTFIVRLGPEPSFGTLSLGWHRQSGISSLMYMEFSEGLPSVLPFFEEQSAEGLRVVGVVCGLIRERFGESRSLLTTESVSVGDPMLKEFRTKNKP